MPNTKQGTISFSPEFFMWAKEKIAQDEEYIRQRAKFGPEPIKSIAKLILSSSQKSP